MGDGSSRRAGQSRGDGGDFLADGNDLLATTAICECRSFKTPRRVASCYLIDAVEEALAYRDEDITIDREARVIGHVPRTILALCVSDVLSPPSSGGMLFRQVP